MPNTNPTTDFAEQIRECLEEILHSDPTTLIMGLGVTDPKGVFGTTLGLHQNLNNSLDNSDNLNKISELRKIGD